MSPLLLLVIGIIIGTVCTGYFTIPAFRERVHSVFNGLVFGKQGRKSKSPTEAPKAEKAVRRKQHTCMRCGQFGTIDDMDEVDIKGSRATAWIHTHCLNDLPENGG